MKIGDIVSYELREIGSVLDGLKGKGQVLKIGKNNVILSDNGNILTVEHSEIKL